MPHRPTPRARVTRRTLVAGALGAAALPAAACDVLDDLGGGGADGPGDGVSPTAAAVDADSRVVADAVAALLAAAALADATATAVPGLARAGARLARLHRAHADELGGGDDVASPTVPGSATAARRALLRSEERLQATLVRGCLDAGSGALAQVLAAMAAVVAQQRAVLA